VRRTPVARTALVAAAVTCLSIASTRGQAPGPAPLPSQTPTFRTGVRVIEFDVVVTDDDGEFVAGLTKDDFEVFEGSCPALTVRCPHKLQPQEIASVWELNLPVDRAGRPLPPAASSASGATDGGYGDSGRVYILMLHSGDPMRVRALGRRFVEEFLGPTDLMAVLHGTRAATRGLTNSKELLLAAIDGYQGGGGDVFFRLKEVAVNLNAVSGRRKAILFVGVVPSNFLDDRRAEREYDDAVRTAVRNNVRIYPIDPRGFTQSAPWELPPIGVNIPSPGFGEPRGMAARVMAADTGGIAITNTGNFDGGFRRIVRDNSSYYTIAFYTSAERDGAFHQVSVRVKGRPDLQVRSRMGYRSTAPDVKGRSAKLPKTLSASARDALSSGTPQAGLPLEIFTAVFQAEKYEGSILVGAHLPGSALKLAPKDRIELSYMAVDRWGTTRAVERRAFTLTFTDAMRSRVEQTGLRLFGRMQLPRGVYEVRVAAHQPGGATGAAAAEVEVPDYTGLPLSISDFVIASSHGRTLTTLEEDPILRRALPSQPTVDRRFSPPETLTVFGEIYDSHWILSREIGVTQIVRSADGRIVNRAESALQTSNRGRFYYTGTLRLANFAPGKYVLGIEAYTRDGVPASASQQLDFEVVGQP
jgi:VWFA-related protein